MSERTGTSGLRLFVGMRLAAAAREQLGERTGLLESTGSRSIRLIPRENYHITLYFIGDPRPITAGMVEHTLDERLPAVVERVLPVETQIQRWGVFPSRKRPRVVWAGVADDGEIAGIAGEVTAALETLGMEAPRRRFTPHITVGYVRREVFAADVAAALEEHAFGAPVAVRLDSVSLIKSTPGPDGSTYEDLKMWRTQR
ncbi:MAG: RNA 2',3'-cyclic phosphodiesterase [Alkalispirochaeta sp.]